MEFFNAVSAERASELLYTALGERETEIIELEDAFRRICAEDLICGENIPPFSRSTVDGYAVISADTLGSSDALPSLLKFAGSVEMGRGTDISLKRGEAAAVPTGGMIPKGSDCAVMIEYTERLGEFVALSKPAAVKENTVAEGGDITAGETVVRKGELMDARSMARAAAAGFKHIKAYVKPRFAIISTGDELIGVQDVPNVGEIRDINTYLLSGAVKSVGGEVVFASRTKDVYEDIEKALKDAARSADIVLLSGGSSVGQKDMTAEIIRSAGQVLCHGIALKPGKPTIVGRACGKAVLGLPGHPMAAYMTLLLLFSKAEETRTDVKILKTVKAQAAVNFPSAPGKTSLIPVKLTISEKAVLTAEPLFGKSGMVSVLGKADGFAVLEEKTEGVARGGFIEVCPFVL